MVFHVVQLLCLIEPCVRFFEVNKNKGLVLSMEVRLGVLQRLNGRNCYFCVSLTVAC